jgi:hypothetical protein
VEKGVDGNLVVGININPPSVDYSPGRDDGYAIVSLEGKILETHSVTRILHDNGYLGLLMAFSNVNSQDRLHLNDAQPIYEDNNIAKRGDIALSMRHLSTVAVYRPLDNNIVALQFGPWLFQHDINILPDGRFSIFNNYSIKGRTNSGKPLSTVMIWDPVSGTIESPYKEILKQANMHTSGGGRSRILPNGDVFVEETGRNRLLRVSPDRVRWEYVNAPEDKPEASGALHWSRYYLPDEIPLDWLEGTQ